MNKVSKRRMVERQPPATCLSYIYMLLLFSLWLLCLKCDVETYHDNCIVMNIAIYFQFHYNECYKLFLECPLLECSWN